ncbi:MAG: hypothetical protein F4Y94_09430 [Chloroflexi bacterium]|nr:hypothetical protein [Chloroflexota bacterium]
MTTRNDPDQIAGVVDWLEAEVSSLKAKLSQIESQTQEDRTRLWQISEASQRAESGAANVVAQLKILSDLPEDVRLLRERSERIQAALGQDSEQMELLGRQLRAEMQAERDERGELRRRTEFAEQAALTGAEKVHVAEEMSQRAQETMSVVNQRLEQSDINVAGLNARLEAVSEALRRLQDDGRTASSEIEGHDRLFTEMGDRMERFSELARRVQERFEDSERSREEAEALRDRFESMRVDNEAAIARVGAMQSEHEQIQARFAEFERSLERSRTRADQHERALGDLRAAFDDLRELLQRDTERLLGFQEKLRRRQISDLEQEIREIRGHIRQQAESRNA